MQAMFDVKGRKNNRIPPNRDGWSVHVGNIDMDKTEDSLISLFETVGKVKRCRVLRQKEGNGQFAFIYFGILSEAMAAVERFNKVPPHRYTVELSKESRDAIQKDNGCRENDEEINEHMRSVQVVGVCSMCSNTTTNCCTCGKFYCGVVCQDKDYDAHQNVCKKSIDFQAILSEARRYVPRKTRLEENKSHEVVITEITSSGIFKINLCCSLEELTAMTEKLQLKAREFKSYTFDTTLLISGDFVMIRDKRGCGSDLFQRAKYVKDKEQDGYGPFFQFCDSGRRLYESKLNYNEPIYPLPVDFLHFPFQEVVCRFESQIPLGYSARSIRDRFMRITFCLRVIRKNKEVYFVTLRSPDGKDICSFDLPGMSEAYGSSYHTNTEVISERGETRLSRQHTFHDSQSTKLNGVSDSQSNSQKRLPFTKEFRTSTYDDSQDYEVVVDHDYKPGLHRSTSDIRDSGEIYFGRETSREHKDRLTDDVEMSRKQMPPLIKSSSRHVAGINPDPTEEFCLGVKHSAFEPIPCVVQNPSPKFSAVSNSVSSVSRASTPTSLISRTMAFPIDTSLQKINCITSDLRVKDMITLRLSKELEGGFGWFGCCEVERCVPLKQAVEGHSCTFQPELTASVPPSSEQSVVMAKMNGSNKWERAVLLHTRDDDEHLVFGIDSGKPPGIATEFEPFTGSFAAIAGFSVIVVPMIPCLPVTRSAINQLIRFSSDKLEACVLTKRSPQEVIVELPSELGTIKLVLLAPNHAFIDWGTIIFDFVSESCEGTQPSIGGNTTGGLDLPDMTLADTIDEEIVSNVINWQDIGESILKQNGGSVVIQHINDQHSIYVVNGEDISRLEIITEQLTAYEKTRPKGGYKPVVGELVVCLYSGEFYRAAVLSVDIAIVQVLYVDYGNIQSVEFGLIYPPTQELGKCPCLAIKVCLHGVADISAAASNYLLELTNDMLAMTVIDAKKPPSVRLTTKDGDDVAKRLLAMDDKPTGRIKPIVDGQEQGIAVNRLPPKLQSSVRQSSIRKGSSGPFQFMIEAIECIDLKENQNYQFTLLNVIGPDCIRCTLDDSSLEKKLTELTHEMDKYYNVNNDPSYRPIVREVCVAMYQNSWYRAVVQEVHNNGNVTVLYIDYGNTETVSAGEVQPIQEQFTRINRAVVTCQMNNLAADHFSIEKVAHFKGIFTNGSQHSIRIISKSSFDKYVIEFVGEKKRLVDSGFIYT